MEREKLIYSYIEDLVLRKTHLVINNPEGELSIEYKSQLVLTTAEGKKVVLVWLGSEIHGNAKEKLLKDMMEKYPYEKIYKLALEHIDKLKAKAKKEEENKYRLEELLVDINNILKDYIDKKYNAVEVRHGAYNALHYQLEIRTLSPYNTRYYISFSDDYKNFSMFYQCKRLNYTKAELLNLIKKDKEKFDKHKILIEKEEKEKRLIEDKRIALLQLEYDLNKINCDIIFKSKAKNYTVYRNGIKFSLKGAGKYYKGDLNKLINNAIAYAINENNNSYKFINTKNIEKELNFISISK